jgi:hypothetical protein
MRCTLTMFGLLWLAGCAVPADSVCVTFTRPPFTLADTQSVSEPLARWLLHADQMIEDKCQ